ncbi:MAG: NAD(P)-binding domain-containing protein [Motiliproteus sp.]
MSTPRNPVTAAVRDIGGNSDDNAGDNTGGSRSTIIIGGGHAGLAISRCLSERSIDHQILERGEVGNAWRRDRWDSLRLLTPNWQCRLPGYAYNGDDPDGFMTMSEVSRFIDDYARFIDAPVQTGTSVTAVHRRGQGYQVVTDRGEWFCHTLVIATGAFSQPLIPAISKALPPSINQLTPKDYRNPAQLANGGVLVVGGSATGLQLADEIQRSGRPVTLSVGEHVRLPRVYRGRDIQWWMDATGILDEGYDEVDDINRARRVPSPQLVGTPERNSLDLNVLTAQGVKLVGRLMAINDMRTLFSGALNNHCALADLKMNRLLDHIDSWIGDTGLDTTLPPAQRYPATRVDGSPCLTLDLEQSGIRSIIWATGFRPDYSWLKLPVFDHKGRLRHDGGVVDAPGIYVTGLPFMRRRKSSFIHGAEDDARDLSSHLSNYLDCLSSGQTWSAA